jgi:hypothetical protein
MQRGLKMVALWSATTKPSPCRLECDNLLCALQGRYDEAGEWFANSRAVLEEQRARPLLAIADFDEAMMYARRGATGDKDHARSLLNAAIDQFSSIGMTGWLRRAQALASRVT